MNNFNNFDNLNEEAFQYGIQHSFCRKLEQDLSGEDQNSYKVVENFSIEEGNGDKSSQMDQKINDQSRDHFLSTRSTKKSEDHLYGGNLIQGSANDILFSGYFGTKNEGVCSQMGNIFNSTTNPFPMVEEERNYKKYYEIRNSNTEFQVFNSKLPLKKQKSGDDSFNGSFLSLSSNIKTQKNFLKKENSLSNSFVNMNTSTYSACSSSFNDLVKNVSLSTLKNKKKVISSEELLIDKIKKEKEDMQRLRSVNNQNVEKTKIFIHKPINPSPLTLIKPFNLSTNNSKMLAKKRITNHNIDEVNSKITEQMKRKCEMFGEKVKDSIFITDTIKLQKTPTNVKFMKRTLGRSRSTSKSPLKNNNDEELQSLSKRIEKYCVISGVGINSSASMLKPTLTSRNKSKSPFKICFSNFSKENEEKVMNHYIGSILNTESCSPLTSSTSSIRKYFGMNYIPTEEKIVKEMQTYKFKAKPLNKNLFTKKQPELESFESVLQRTRLEKQLIDKKEKDLKKFNKVNLIKQNKVSKMMSLSNKENENNYLNRNSCDEFMLTE